MKILHTADWHIGNFPGPEKDGVNLRSVDTGNCINHLQMVVMVEKPDFIVISGDLFHQARVWADRGLNEVKTAIRALEVISDYAPVIVLRGTPNHDGSEQFAMLQEHFNGNDAVRIITEPTVLQFKGYETDQQWANVACLPGFDRGVYRAKFPGLSKEEENQVFTEELGKITLGLKAECKPELPSIFISHYTIPGCNTESGQTQFLAQFEPVILPEALDAANFDLVAFGHIHRPQQLKSCKNTFYSGAINAMNFNDEGQDRGFYIHNFDGNTLIKSDFYKTPIREFLTLRLDDEKISRWNADGDDLFITDNVKDKIVRVIYSCTEANAKALNKSLLEQRLYENGAFWVSEITPEKISISVNRNTLDDKTDPVANLTEYLRDKTYTDEQIAKAIEIGTPIIDEVLANTKISRLTGIFEPVEISVRNYRNYEEEIFNFNDITFCTINGKNGAGKSSLFMDAILDCLYEEPREGELTGWIRADEKARSGSIAFTFKIGEKTFRVTRTRAKSGKATLNLSEWVNDEWVNRSAERIKDTQEEIINILGMDSLTFRSCALIMQDQYGLFLQADKESRVSILSNILGLGMYSDMQELAKTALAETNREIAFNNAEITKLGEKITGADDIELQICESNMELKANQSKYNELSSEKGKQTLSLSMLQKAHERAIQIKVDVNTLEAKKTSTVSQRSIQANIVEEANKLLSLEDEILQGVEKHKELLEQEKHFIAGKNSYDSKISELANVSSSINATVSKITSLEMQSDSIYSKISEMEEKLKRENELKQAFDSWSLKKSELETANQTYELYKTLANDEMNIERELITQKSFYSQHYNEKAIQVKQLKSKMELLHNAQCIDIEKATCRFLADAIEAKKQYEPLMEECKIWKTAELAKLSKLEEKHNLAKKKIIDLNFDTYLPRKLQVEISTLEAKAMVYQGLQAVKNQLDTTREMLNTITSEITSQKAELEEMRNKEHSLKTEVTVLSQAAAAFSETQKKITETLVWLEKEKQLPVAKERKVTAEQRISELSTALAELDVEISIKNSEYQKEMESALGKEEVEQKLSQLSSLLTSCQVECEELQRKIGSLTNQLDSIHKDKKQMQEIAQKVKKLSEKSETLDVLKQAFSSDGVPHNIIRAMLPMITATANNILGQMTGGKMGMEFRTEKVLKSNNKKEVVTLDIFIEEYGKPSLPYSSKSGGEKVKSSLSAILALAETKSTSAGIRLGMLFIDEPPFLDGDGIQAYCDALETIRQRYSDIKIMAITHDPTMKARFPQNLDVVKTDNGSKVIFE
ncbi:metallophosphoesterase [Anaerovorax sp. IOR16]|uniref:metallophosphoesterase n=1 Tax=Anaerovorax sp. IOR16 TaxID=2773458 RepID=UPI0019CF8BDB|nr:metallophosphoesterase [Anaerovorax sp. IOR16]